MILSTIAYGTLLFVQVAPKAGLLAFALYVGALLAQREVGKKTGTGRN